jgi:hypothetical protein
MTDKAISPLRQRMIEDMTIRKLTPKTQHDYVQRVKNFAAFLGRSPDTASFEDVRRYQLDLATSGAGVPTLNQSVSTPRFFFRVTLGRADIVNHTQFVHEPRKLPVVLSPEEVARFLDAAPAQIQGGIGRGLWGRIARDRVSRAEGIRHRQVADTNYPSLRGHGCPRRTLVEALNPLGVPRALLTRR